MYFWDQHKNKVKNKLINTIMEEFSPLLDEPDNEPSANYWIDDAHNVSAFINDNGDDDKWIEIHYELYDMDEEKVGDLTIANTEYTDREELLRAVTAIVDDYYGD